MGGYSLIELQVLLHKQTVRRLSKGYDLYSSNLQIAAFGTNSKVETAEQEREGWQSEELHDANLELKRCERSFEGGRGCRRAKRPVLI